MVCADLFTYLFGGPNRGTQGEGVNQRDEQRGSGTAIKLPTWAQYFLGGLGALWLIGATGYFFWTQLPHLSLLGRGLLGAWWLCTIVWVTSILWPVKAQDEVHPTDYGNVWFFLRGPQPSSPP